jgi:putative spermidine/putrescine transport system permease protein
VPKIVLDNPALRSSTVLAGNRLRARIRAARRRENLRAALLIAPLFLYLGVFFFYPVASMLMHSVSNEDYTKAFPRTAAAIRSWSGAGLPDESVYRAMTADVRGLHGDHQLLGRAARRLNSEIPGFRSLILDLPRLLAAIEGQPSVKDAVIAAEARWGDRSYWAVIRRSSMAFTDYYVLQSVDLRRDADDEIQPMPDDEAIFLDVYGRTVWISVQVVFWCLLVGYPFTFFLAGLSDRRRNLLMFFVLLPFWTALLVRTTAWIVLLQREGLVNDLLRLLGLVDEPLQLIFSRPGVIIVMTHVLLPFFILPLYSVMRSINPQFMRAARSLGAHPFEAFLRVYLPLSMPGVAAGSLLVFIISLGFYVTPALVGGSRDQLVSTFIARYVEESLDWGQASALAAFLLVFVLVFYLVYHRLTGGRRIHFG